MAFFTTEDIVEATKGRLIRRGRADGCRGVSTDTRTIQQGELFVPLTGEHFDGHRFIPQAVQKGASAVVASETLPEGTPLEGLSVIEVEDTLQALEDLARFHRQRFSIPVVAVTGSNGKTTTKDMISAVLGTKYRVCHTEKNFNTEIGLSWTILNLKQDDEVCVTEMGMRGLGQIAELCRIACPTIGVVTNVGTAHIGILGSQKNIQKAKEELVQSLPPSGVAVLNGDDPLVREMADRFGGQVCFYGLEENWPVSATGIHAEGGTVDFQCRCFGDSFAVHLPVPGIHNVYDALAAIAVGHQLGVPQAMMQEALARFAPQGDSQKIETIGGALVLNDCYNANPLSMDMAFRAFSQLPGYRHILVLGDMLELGTYAEEMHREMGRKAAAFHFDEMVTVGTMARWLADEARKAGMNRVVSFDDCQAVGAYLRSIVHDGDAVLIKGSHAMHMETIPDFWKGASN